MHQSRLLGETIQRFNDGRKAFQEAFESLGKMSLDFQNHLISAARDTVGSLELALKVYLFSYCHTKLTPEDKKKKTQNPKFDDLIQMMVKYADPALDSFLIRKLYDYRELRNSAEHDASVPCIEHLQEALDTIREFLLKYLSVSEEKLLTAREIWEESRQVKSVSNPRAFFSGGMPNTSDVAKDIDVRRTQYIQDWADENSIHQEAWKNILLEQAESTLSKRKVRIVIVYGHRGSGKKTLCKRMVYDLQQASIPVIDRLGDPLSEEDANSILRCVTRTPTKCLHIFSKIEDIHDPININSHLTVIKRLKNLQAPLCIYISIDTNKWKLIKLNFAEAVHSMGCDPVSRHLRGQFDERELDELIVKLREHKCLFHLEHKTDEQIRQLFKRKAKKDLLTSLIEVTRGTEEGQGLADILWREFTGLTNKGRWAYGLITVFSAFGISVPFGVVGNALKDLTGNAGYFGSPSFSAEVAGILVSQGMDRSFSARHRLIAETLLQRFKDEQLYDFLHKILYNILLTFTKVV